MLPKPGAVLATHKPGVDNGSTPLEVNRERGLVNHQKQRCKGKQHLVLKTEP